MGARIKLRNLIGAATAVATASVVALAVAHPGIVSKEVNLNDGGVWVTNRTCAWLGTCLTKPKPSTGAYAPTPLTLMYAKTAPQCL